MQSRMEQLAGAAWLATAMVLAACVGIFAVALTVWAVLRLFIPEAK